MPDFLGMFDLLRDRTFSVLDERWQWWLDAARTQQDRAGERGVSAVIIRLCEQMDDEGEHPFAVPNENGEIWARIMSRAFASHIADTGRDVVGDHELDVCMEWVRRTAPSLTGVDGVKLPSDAEERSQAKGGGKGKGKGKKGVEPVKVTRGLFESCVKRVGADKSDSHAEVVHQWKCAVRALRPTAVRNTQDAKQLMEMAHLMLRRERWELVADLPSSEKWSVEVAAMFRDNHTVDGHWVGDEPEAVEASEVEAIIDSAVRQVDYSVEPCVKRGKIIGSGDAIAFPRREAGDSSESCLWPLGQACEPELVCGAVDAPEGDVPEVCVVQDPKVRLVRGIEGELEIGDVPAVVMTPEEARAQFNRQTASVEGDHLGDTIRMSAQSSRPSHKVLAAAIAVGVRYAGDVWSQILDDRDKVASRSGKLWEYLTTQTDPYSEMMWGHKAPYICSELLGLERGEEIPRSDLLRRLLPPAVDDELDAIQGWMDTPKGYSMSSDRRALVYGDDLAAVSRALRWLVSRIAHMIYGFVDNVKKTAVTNCGRLSDIRKKVAAAQRRCGEEETLYSIEFAEYVYTCRIVMGLGLKIDYHAIAKPANLVKQDSGSLTATLGLKKRTTVWASGMGVEGNAKVRDQFRKRQVVSRMIREVFVLHPWMAKTSRCVLRKAERRLIEARCKNQVPTAAREFLARHHPEATPADKAVMERGLVCILPPSKPHANYLELSQILESLPDLPTPGRICVQSEFEIDIDFDVPSEVREKDLVDRMGSISSGVALRLVKVHGAGGEDCPPWSIRGTAVTSSNISTQGTGKGKGGKSKGKGTSDGRARICATVRVRYWLPKEKYEFGRQKKASWDAEFIRIPGGQTPISAKCHSAECWIRHTLYDPSFEERAPHPIREEWQDVREPGVAGVLGKSEWPLGQTPRETNIDGWEEYKGNQSMASRIAYCYGQMSDPNVWAKDGVVLRSDLGNRERLVAATTGLASILSVPWFGVGEWRDVCPTGAGNSVARPGVTGDARE
jgi:hypothetical protein